MNRCICIHGHFYQPPRENPWLEEIEIQDSAYPYHDWNSRITAECYAPNTASRILDPERKIIDIVNNYSKISFNFGPTLLSWMEKQQPAVYEAILEADKKSRERFSGHGSAIAQAYNHIIMPLANSADKRTQIIWGIRDFEHRFQRRPEGMWLAETAVDLETLELLAEYNISFTILAPHQARTVRRINDPDWHDVNGARINPRMPYRCNLPSGRAITIFFYDGPISQEIAFNSLLQNGEQFAGRLLSAFSPDDHEPQLVHIATDGETYGHHHRHGDMALAFCLYHLEAHNHARITVYGEYLEHHPPTHEVEIIENSSWSCIHGIERWRSDCGCNSGMQPQWHQAWRAPLRGAMDWLRDNLISVYEEHAAPFADDPWNMRDAYIAVILDRSDERVEHFLAEHVARELTPEEKTGILKLLEMQRHAMLMYTSCGWFFDEISGLENVQVLQYAARAMQLARETSSIMLEDVFTQLLKRAPGNIPDLEHGEKVYEMFVKPAVLDLVRVAVHYAVSSLFRDYAETAPLYTYTARRLAYDRLEMGRQKAVVGRAVVQSSITLEDSDISFSVLHLGDHNIIGGAREYMGEDAFSAMHTEIKESCMKGELSEVILLIDKHFRTHNYSLWHLFKNEQREILTQIFSLARKETENSFRQLYEHNYPIMQAVVGLTIPLPKYFSVILDFVINTDIRSLLENGAVDYERLLRLVNEAKRWKLELDRPQLGLIVSKKIKSFMETLSPAKESISIMQHTINLLKTTEALALDLNLWQSQTIYFTTGMHVLPEMKDKAAQGSKDAQQWVEQFNQLGGYLKVRIE
jgi:alpha-amylase/alpha-mannosidase (GH57 family)